MDERILKVNTLGKIFFVILLLSATTMFAQSYEVEVRVDGLSCPFCAYGLEKKLNKLDGVENIDVDFEKGLVTLRVREDKKISKKDIKTKVEEAGFTTKEIKDPKSDNQIIK